MSKTIKIKNTELGSGIPKICVPITAKTPAELTASIQTVKSVPFDLIEWRADFYSNMENPEVLKQALSNLRREFPNTPILFTIRTAPEGGEAKLDTAFYKKLLLSVIECRLADLVDVELSRGEEVMKTILAAAHENEMTVIASRHDFHATPKKEEIVQCLCRMQELGADIAKFAGMPQKERDVLTLLDATLTMKEEHPKLPVITMSMSPLGAVSRICGSLTGSCITFGTAKSASAPGQIPAGQLKQILKTLNENIREVSGI